MSKAQTRDELFAALQAAGNKYMGDSFQLKEIEPLSAGASADTWRFTCSVNGEDRAMILRRSAGKDEFSVTVEKKTEALVQKAAAEQGVACASVSFIFEEEDGIGEGYVMDLIEGETIPRKILRDEKYAHARSMMASQAGEIAARIHAVSLDTLPPLDELTPEKNVEQTENFYRSLNQKQPVFEMCFRWLKANLPDSGKITLVHGDYRNGNIIVGEEGIRCVLDWELTHLGDPMEDLGWICVNSWRFGNIDLPVGGFGRREELFSAYEKTSGAAVNPRDVLFWEVFGTLKWGVICIFQSSMHLNGIVRSVERAAIGRRVSETELDLLNLIEKPWA